MIGIGDQVRDGTISALKDLKLNIVSKLEIRTTQDGSNALMMSQNSDWHQGYCFCNTKIATFFLSI